MATIMVSPELLKGRATELRGLRQVHDDTMSRMGTLIRGLDDVMKGQAHDALVAKYESMQSTFTSFSEMIENYAKIMDQTATEMETEDNGRASRINSSF